MSAPSSNKAIVLNIPFTVIIYTRCTNFFCLSIIKDPPMIFYFIIGGSSKSKFAEKNLAIQRCPEIRYLQYFNKME